MRFEVIRSSGYEVGDLAEVGDELLAVLERHSPVQLHALDPCRISAAILTRARI